MKIGAIILAAGGSSRMDNGNKLLMTIDGKPMIASVVDTIAPGGFRPVVVVSGYDETALHQALAGRQVQFVSNTHWEQGLSSSLRAGIAALPPETRGVAIMLGDMPLLKVATLQALKDCFEAQGGEKIVYPTYRGQQGNPVFFPRRLFPELLALQGDMGARKLLRQMDIEDTIPVPVGTSEVLEDCDTDDDYTHILALLED